MFCEKLSFLIGRKALNEMETTESRSLARGTTGLDGFLKDADFKLALEKEPLQHRISRENPEGQ